MSINKTRNNLIVDDVIKVVDGGRTPIALIERTEHAKLLTDTASITIIRGSMFLKKLIAYCGLDCEKCDARIATLNDDGARRKKVAELWSEMNGAEITPEMIN